MNHHYVTLHITLFSTAALKLSFCYNFVSPSQLYLERATTNEHIRRDGTRSGPGWAGAACARRQGPQPPARPGVEWTRPCGEQGAVRGGRSDGVFARNEHFEARKTFSRGWSLCGRETLAGHQVSLGDLGAGLGLPADARRWVCALQTGTEVFRRPRARRDMLEQQSTEPGWAGAQSGALFQDHR